MSTLAVSMRTSIRSNGRPASFDVLVRGTTVDQWGKNKLAATATTALARPDFEMATELEQESGSKAAPMSG